jgi:hypothetical protein
VGRFNGFVAMLRTEAIRQTGCDIGIPPSAEIDMSKVIIVTTAQVR